MSFWRDDEPNLGQNDLGSSAKSQQFSSYSGVPQTNTGPNTKEDDFDIPSDDDGNLLLQQSLNKTLNV